MTGPDVIVNDVYVDPDDSDHVLLATDRGGVLASKDGAASFAASNEGFSGRKVAALLVDRGNPARLFAGVVNDKGYGGVFVSTNGGAGWEQIGDGPTADWTGAMSLSSRRPPDGTVLAGTSHGIFALAAGTADTTPVWQPRNTIANTVLKTATEIHEGEHVNVEKQVRLLILSWRAASMRSTFQAMSGWPPPALAC